MATERLSNGQRQRGRVRHRKRGDGAFAHNTGQILFD
jgi:hypothetical protein